MFTLFSACALWAVALSDPVSRYECVLLYAYSDSKLMQLMLAWSSRPALQLCVSLGLQGRDSAPTAVLFNSTESKDQAEIQGTI